jgi:hypothetical protein
MDDARESVVGRVFGMQESLCPNVVKRLLEDRNNPLMTVGSVVGRFEVTTDSSYGLAGLEHVVVREAEHMD